MCQLRFHPAGPFDDCITANRILERIDQHICAARACSKDGRIHIGHEIAGALGAKRIGNRRFVTEDRERAMRRQHQLRQGAARRRGDGENSAFRRASTEGGDDARDEAIKIGWGDINMRRIVLGRNGDGCRWRTRRLRLNQAGHQERHHCSKVQRGQQCARSVPHPKLLPRSRYGFTPASISFQHKDFRWSSSRGGAARPVDRTSAASRSSETADNSPAGVPTDCRKSQNTAAARATA